jgi:hypothetical protein
MGINTHYYTVYGVKIDEFSDEFSEAWDEVYDDVKDNKDMALVLDGMSGSYMIFGKILFDSGDLRWGDYEDVHSDIDLNKLSEYKDKCVEQFMNYFPSFGSYMDHEWKLMTFVHYS